MEKKQLTVEELMKLEMDELQEIIENNIKEAEVLLNIIRRV
ncbi:hypothetical protein ABNB59_17270 [Paenibacillus larvae]|uniref:Uncharacterized protein n=2 Tax=Paenibacillus larvae TaxID=1464 RepID=A0A6C0QUM3_9BACL|nr:hypothetical protein [Paenibacillus larvae]AVF21812.1 hypothetical protein ERICI_01949 [Paenibacillus larvae subsp. larvae]AVG13045.1 hypothetical protein ERICII_02691 [Paenibacillus larvae subsp. larvae DSM 25430]ETK27493.1 hypothetical protein ERIC1_1c09390 [Paenibacillus larvae subsp. larvae DSM 25719]MDE5127930.1 hypothetical protein [Paenibacillus larvae subsp. larvae]MDE5135444.1 hypothetical protein [Paenibacillus larvae subsp. larvae]